MAPASPLGTGSMAGQDSATSRHPFLLSSLQLVKVENASSHLVVEGAEEQVLPLLMRDKSDARKMHCERSRWWYYHCGSIGITVGSLDAAAGVSVGATAKKTVRSTPGAAVSSTVGGIASAQGTAMGGSMNWPGSIEHLGSTTASGSAGKDFQHQILQTREGEGAAGRSRSSRRELGNVHKSVKDRGACTVARGMLLKVKARRRRGRGGGW